MTFRTRYAKGLANDDLEVRHDTEEDLFVEQPDESKNAAQNSASKPMLCDPSNFRHLGRYVLGRSGQRAGKSRRSRVAKRSSNRSGARAWRVRPAHHHYSSGRLAARRKVQPAISGGSDSRKARARRSGTGAG